MGKWLILRFEEILGSAPKKNPKFTQISFKNIFRIADNSQKLLPNNYKVKYYL